MKKTRLVLACLITAACFSTFVISCKKSSSNDTPTICTCNANYEGHTVLEPTEFNLKDASQEFNENITSCAQLSSVLANYFGQGQIQVNVSCE